MPKFKDLSGATFGRLTVIERANDYISPSGYHKTRWRCICKCGKEAVVVGEYLLRGDTKSCGCLEIESKIKNGTTHGKSKTPLYYVWKNIKGRCYNSNHVNYKDYGGRGIKMCDEWHDSFENFANWALSSGYSEGLTVDRINNDGLYEPSNCRLVGRKEQANNRRNSITITYNGATMNISEWADMFGMKYSTIYSRLKRGLSADKIFNQIA